MLKQTYYLCIQQFDNEPQEESQTGTKEPNERVMPRVVTGTYKYMNVWYMYIEV